MDDGYVDQAEIASPIFLEYEFPITFFVITGMLDKTIVPWDTQISWIVQNSKPTSLQDYTVLKDIGLELNTAITRRELRRIILSTLKNFRAEEIDLILHKLTIETGLHPTRHTSEQYQPMTWDMARDLERQGVRFAPHSVSHYILSRLSREVMTEEITKSWLSMEKELRSPLKIFCFPNGHAADYGEREITLLKDLGFQGAVTATPAYVDPKMPSMSQIFRLPRLAFPNNMTDFIQLCSWIDRAREKANVDSAEYDV